MESSQPVDEKTFRLLLLKNSEHLTRYIEGRLPRKLGPFLCAEDILQETWMAAFRDFRQLNLDTDDSFDRWIARIADHRIIDAVRYARAARRSPGKDARVLDQRAVSSVDQILALLPAPNQRTPSSEGAARESARAIQIALCTLAPPRREVVTMFHIEGLSRKEIAVRLKKKLPTVSALLYRGRVEMKKSLGPAALFFSDVGDEPGS